MSRKERVEAWDVPNLQDGDPRLELSRKERLNIRNILALPDGHPRLESVIARFMRKAKNEFPWAFHLHLSAVSGKKFPENRELWMRERHGEAVLSDRAAIRAALLHPNA